MESIFELWLKGIDSINDGTKIYPVEGEGDTALYRCWKNYIGKDHHEYNTTPVYIGWVRGKKVCAVQNYLSALASWAAASRADRENGE